MSPFSPVPRGGLPPVIRCSNDNVLEVSSSKYLTPSTDVTQHSCCCPLCHHNVTEAGRTLLGGLEGFRTHNAHTCPEIPLRDVNRVTHCHLLVYFRPGFTGRWNDPEPWEITHYPTTTSRDSHCWSPGEGSLRRVSPWVIVALVCPRCVRRHKTIRRTT